MRVPLNWLHDYCDPGSGSRELEHRLTMTGTKVEARRTRTASAALEHFVVGRVLSAEQHPDADRLTVCMVDAATGDPRRSCAARRTSPRARSSPSPRRGDDAGRHEAQAREAARRRVPRDDPGRGRARHRRPTTTASWCSTPTLEPGTPLADVLPIATDVLELEITPNRPDCLGIYGVAREVHAATGAPLAPPPWADDPGGPGDVPGVRIEVEDPSCARATPRGCSRT